MFENVYRKLILNSCNAVCLVQKFDIRLTFPFHFCLHNINKNYRFRKATIFTLLLRNEV